MIVNFMYLTGLCTMGHSHLNLRCEMFSLFRDRSSVKRYVEGYLPLDLKLAFFHSFKFSVILAQSYH